MIFSTSSRETPPFARFCRSFLCSLLLGLAPGFMNVHAQNAKPRAITVVDRIIAVVNDEIITANELAVRVDLALSQLRQQGTPLPPRTVIEQQLLERLISDRVQLQHARDTGLRIDDTEIDRAITRIAESNKISVAQMRTTLERDGVPFQKFREDIHNEIILSRLREREVAQKIVVTETEIEHFIQSQKALGSNDEYNLSHILVTVPENASPEQVQARQARAEQALAQIKGGADFRQVAAAFSEAPEALQGGVLGWRKTDRLPSLFLDALKSIKPGELSGLLRSSNGFHILRLNELRGGQAPIMVQQTHARHILIKTNELVSEAEARNRLLALKERLDNKADDFADLARTRSEDGSAPRGGDLGWLSPGDTVPEFERAMNALKLKEISAPVQSPFGWHLIQVLERRTQDMTQEGRRFNARQALREQKTDEAYQEWVRQLRDRAYVERRLEEKIN